MSRIAPGPSGVNTPRPPADAGLDPSITPNEKAVLLALDAHEGMACYHALYQATGLRGSSLQRAIRGLEARGHDPPGHG